jgi:hypothetical protein
VSPLQSSRALASDIRLDDLIGNEYGVRAPEMGFLGRPFIHLFVNTEKKVVFVFEEPAENVEGDMLPVVAAHPRFHFHDI